MKENGTKSLIGRCLDHCSSKEAAIILRGYPVEVLIAARIKGAKNAGASLGKEICGKAVSATPILNIVAMVESGEIAVTQEEILKVVNQDERSIRFYKQNPWLIDPTGSSAPPTKKGRKPAEKASTDPNELKATPSKKTRRTIKVAKPTSSRPSESKQNTEQGEEEPSAPPRLTGEALRKLAEEEKEHQKKSLQLKAEEPKPSNFRGTPAPPVNASEEERKEWRKIRQQEIDEHIKQERDKGWEYPPDWDGLGSVAKVAKWIGKS